MLSSVQAWISSWFRQGSNRIRSFYIWWMFESISVALGALHVKTNTYTGLSVFMFVLLLVGLWIEKTPEVNIPKFLFLSSLVFFLQLWIIGGINV